MLLKICLFSPLDLRSPCLTGTWQEAATLTVVVKSTSMSQSVGQMASHILTLVWPAVLIVGILALGWVYFTSSCTVVHLTAGVKDVFRIQRQTQDFGLSFQETSKNLQNTCDKNPGERKWCHAITSSQELVEHLGAAVVSPIGPLRLCIWCQLSATW